MDKQTTAQVAKVFGLTKQRLYHILSVNPALRPAERIDKLQRYLWLEGEVQALREYLIQHPRQSRRAHSAFGVEHKTD